MFIMRLGASCLILGLALGASLTPSSAKTEADDGLARTLDSQIAGSGDPAYNRRPSEVLGRVPSRGEQLDVPTRIKKAGLTAAAWIAGPCAAAAGRAGTP